MAKARRSRMWHLWWAAFCLGAGTSTLAQSAPDQHLTPGALQVEAPPTGSLAGRLTDLDSAPLAGIMVVLRNESTGAQVRATTAKNGAFRFASLQAGAYTLEADAPKLGHGSLDGIQVTAGAEARVQAAIRFEPPAPAVVEAAAPSQIAKPPTATLMPLPARAPAPAANAASAAIAPTISAPDPARAASASPPAQRAGPESARPSPPSLAMQPALPGGSPLALAARTALSTSSAVLSASIETGTVRRMPLNAAVVPAINPAQAQPMAAAQHLPTANLPVADLPAQPEVRQKPASFALSTPRRATLETQSATLELALAVTPARTFPLTASPAPALAGGAAAPALLQAAIQNAAPQTPVATAMQRIDPVAPAVTTAIPSRELQALPASGRRWEEFLPETPATSASTDASQVSVRSAEESAEVTIDGASTRLAFGVTAGSASGAPASDPAGQDSDQKNTMSSSWTGGRGLGVSEAAVREVTTTAGNVEAEGLRTAGGRTAIRTESGTGALHGQGFLFDRQNTWGAQNPYTKWLENTGMEAAPAYIASQPAFSSIPFTPPDHETVSGLGLGSRIRRDKLFWFGALDSYHRNDPGMAQAKIPISTYTDPTTGTAYCVGLFCSPSDAQVQLLSAQLGVSESQAYSDYFGIPGSASGLAGLEQLASLLGPAPRTAAQWTGFGRVDWRAAERHRFTLEGIGADWSAPGGGLTRVSENYGSHSFGWSQASQEWILARWEAFLTPNLLAVTQGSAGRDILSSRADTPSTFESTFLQGDGNIYGRLPQIVVDSSDGFTIGNPSRFGQGSYPDERMIHAQEMLDWVHSKLLIKAGLELDHNADATSMLRNQTGTYFYSKVQNFISDALAFETFGSNPSGLQNNTMAWHNCDPAGKPWYGSTGQLMGLGALPCYSYFSQTVGPANWRLDTDDWASYATAQWQPNKIAVISAGLRWEREQLPPPIAALANPELTGSTPGYSAPPFTANLPRLGNNWGPRVSLAIGDGRGRWPVLRLGYGMYYGRVENATVETALTQTGSFNGDLNFFFRPTDGLNSIKVTSAAPFFPDVLEGAASSVVAPGAVGFASNFHNPEVHQAVAQLEQQLPGRVELTGGAMLSLGRRLPITIDTNLSVPASTQTITYNVCDQTPYTPPGASNNGQSVNTNGQCGNLGLGPIKATQITVPFYASWPAGDCAAGTLLNSSGQCGRLNPNYQQISEIMSRANSTYEAAIVRITREGRRGLNLHAHYTYAHAMDWNPNETTLAAGSDVLDPNPADFKYEYGTSDLDVRHSAAVMAIFEPPWKLRDRAGRLANGWMLSGIGQFHSGLPYTMHTSGSLAEEFDDTGNSIMGLAPGMNGSGGDNRVYGVGSDGVTYNIGRNTFRYPSTWKADLRLGKRFELGEMRQLEILAESFNLFNHSNVTELETTGYSIEPGSPPNGLDTAGTLPTLNFLSGLYVNPKTGIQSSAFGQPLSINGTNFYRERQIELGLRMRF